MTHMDRIGISRLFDPRNLDRFRTDDLEAILTLNGFYPSREDIVQAREKYGEFLLIKTPALLGTSFLF